MNKPMIHNAKTPLAQAVLHALRLRETEGFAYTPSEAAREAAEAVGELELAEPVLMMMAEPGRAKMWAESSLNEYEELFLYGEREGTQGDSTVFGTLFKFGNGKKHMAVIGSVDPKKFESLGLAQKWARRLVASWNLCMSIEDELLEYMSAQGIGLAGNDAIETLRVQMNGEIQRQKKEASGG
jgi:hypothetical protein